MAQSSLLPVVVVAAVVLVQAALLVGQMVPAVPARARVTATAPRVPVVPAALGARSWTMRPLSTLVFTQPVAAVATTQAAELGLAVAAVRPAPEEPVAPAGAAAQVADMHKQPRALLAVVARAEAMARQERCLPLRAMPQ